MKLLLKVLFNFVLVLIGVPMFLIKRIHKVPGAEQAPPRDLMDMMMRAKQLDNEQNLQRESRALRAVDVPPGYLLDGRETNPSLTEPVDISDADHNR
jgi:hypothetical protein